MAKVDARSNTSPPIVSAHRKLLLGLVHRQLQAFKIVSDDTQTIQTVQTSSNNAA